MHHDGRPRFHLTPPANWMNDPNGLFFTEGQLHVFYQHNPEAPHWGHTHWGHAVSADLVTWQHLPLAISPDAVGPDSFGCWSGCIVDDGGIPTAFYTGVELDSALRRASVCRATSVDGLVTWVKDPANPCIVGSPDGIAPDAFRDPFVWRDETGWAMLLGAGTTSGLGAVLLYRSMDLRRWEYVGPFLRGDELPRAAGTDAPCWECPQLVRFGGRDVLIISLVDRTPGVRPSHVMALIGRATGDRFVVDHAQQLGMGPDFYAPATILAPDGRQLLLGWVPEDPPHSSSRRDWAGSMTFPRVVSITEGGDVALALAHEVTALRQKEARARPYLPAGNRPPWREGSLGQRFEVQALIEVGDAFEVVVDLLNGDDEDPQLHIGFRPCDRRLSVARRGIVTVAGRSAQSAAILPPTSSRDLRLRILVDGSVAELEVDGQTMATARLGTRGGQRTIAVSAVGGRARIRRLRTWTLGFAADELSAASDRATPSVGSP